MIIPVEDCLSVILEQVMDNHRSIALTVDMKEQPWIDGTKFISDGKVIEYDGYKQECYSPIKKSGSSIKIGTLTKMDSKTVLHMLNNARTAWSHGLGQWPHRTSTDRLSIMKRLIESLRKKREEIIRVIMWDICKSFKNASDEYDLTLNFMEALVSEYYNKLHQQQEWSIAISGGGGVDGCAHMPTRTNHSAVGIVLCFASNKHPLYETYKTLIPALLMGNVAIVKLPCQGGNVTICLICLPSHFVSYPYHDYTHYPFHLKVWYICSH